jgi:hypothetical protein
MEDRRVFEEFREEFREMLKKFLMMRKESCWVF